MSSPTRLTSVVQSLEYNRRGQQVTATPYLSVVSEVPLLCLLPLFGFCSEGQNNFTSFFITHTPCVDGGWPCTHFSCGATEQLSAAMSTTRSDPPGTVWPVPGTGKTTLPFKSQSAKQSHSTKSTTKERKRMGKSKDSPHSTLTTRKGQKSEPVLIKALL